MTQEYTCFICKKKTAEVCPDGDCRELHKLLSWEDCCDGTYNSSRMLDHGWPVGQVRDMYPNSRDKRLRSE